MLNQNEQEILVKYGRLMVDGTKVTPLTYEGVGGVGIRKNFFTDFTQAMNYLNAIRANEIVEAGVKINELPWGAWQRLDTCGGR